MRGLLLVVVGCAACAKGNGGTDVDASGDDAPCELHTFYADRDGDMHGDPNMPMQACEQPPGTSAMGDDCDDLDANRAPGVAEVCDGQDNDCNPATVEVCPAGCTPIRRPPPDNGRVYLMCVNPTSWANAHGVCASAGFTLVQIDDAAENAWLHTTSNQMLGAVDVHIGANDIAAEGQWVWDDGTQFWAGGPNGVPVGGRFAGWRTGEPNNDNNEDCGEMHADGTWNDGSCGDGQRFICRR